MSITESLKYFADNAANPKGLLKTYKADGKKVIGIMPYHIPEELVFAAGMIPMGMWGNNNKMINRAKEFSPTFYCSLVQLDLEMLLDGTLDDLDGVITATMCDTLRPMSQNIKVAVKDKFPMIFVAHPQNRFGKAGKEYTAYQYTKIKNELERIANCKITDEALKNAIGIYNESRAARREFVRLAGEHPEAVSAVARGAVLKSAWFLPKDEYTKQLKLLNEKLAKLPPSQWQGTRVVTSGIICDNKQLLQIFDDNNIAIGADDVSHESRAFRMDIPTTNDDPMVCLAEHFALQDYDPMLYDCRPAEKQRVTFLQNLAKESNAQGVVIFMMQFCDPEETDYPYIKDGLSELNIPHIRLGLDQQMRDFGQMSTSLQAFSTVLEQQMK